MFDPRILAHLGTSHGAARPHFTKLPGLSSQNIPYRLQVTADMRRADLPAFYASSQVLINLIQSAGLTLLLSGWHVNGDVVSFCNYWDMKNDANNLLHSELALPDEPGYGRFAKLWLRETKDIVVPINSVRSKPAPKLDAAHYIYLRAAYRVNFTNLAEFAARLEATLLPFAKSYGWYLGDAYLGLTGDSDSIIQVWIIPQRSIAVASQLLATATWQSLLAAPPQCQTFMPTPHDPLLGLGGMSVGPANGPPKRLKRKDKPEKQRRA